MSHLERYLEEFDQRLDKQSEKDVPSTINSYLIRVVSNLYQLLVAIGGEILNLCLEYLLTESSNYLESLRRSETFQNDQILWLKYDIKLLTAYYNCKKSLKSQIIKIVMVVWILRYIFNTIYFHMFFISNRLLFHWLIQFGYTSLTHLIVLISILPVVYAIMISHQMTKLSTSTHLFDSKTTHCVNILKKFQLIYMGKSFATSMLSIIKFEQNHQLKSLPWVVRPEVRMSLQLAMIKLHIQLSQTLNQWKELTADETLTLLKLSAEELSDHPSIQSLQSIQQKVIQMLKIDYLINYYDQHHQCLSQSLDEVYSSGSSTSIQSLLTTNLLSYSDHSSSSSSGSSSSSSSSGNSDRRSNRGSYHHPPPDQSRQAFSTIGQNAWKIFQMMQYLNQIHQALDQYQNSLKCIYQSMNLKHSTANSNCNPIVDRTPPPPPQPTSYEFIEMYRQYHVMITQLRQHYEVNYLKLCQVEQQLTQSKTVSLLSPAASDDIVHSILENEEKKCFILQELNDSLSILFDIQPEFQIFREILSKIKTENGSNGSKSVLLGDFFLRHFQNQSLLESSSFNPRHIPSLVTDLDSHLKQLFQSLSSNTTPSEYRQSHDGMDSQVKDENKPIVEGEATERRREYPFPVRERREKDQHDPMDEGLDYDRLDHVDDLQRLLDHVIGKDRTTRIVDVFSGTTFPIKLSEGVDRRGNPGMDDPLGRPGMVSMHVLTELTQHFRNQEVKIIERVRNMIANKQSVSVPHSMTSMSPLEGHDESDVRIEETTIIRNLLENENQIELDVGEGSGIADQMDKEAMDEEKRIHALNVARNISLELMNNVRFCDIFKNKGQVFSNEESDDEEDSDFVKG